MYKLTVMVVPLLSVVFLMAVIATMATLRFTRRAYTLKKPKKARNATTYRLLRQNFHAAPSPSVSVLQQDIKQDYSLLGSNTVKFNHHLWVPNCTAPYHVVTSTPLLSRTSWDRDRWQTLVNAVMNFQVP